MKIFISVLSFLMMFAVSQSFAGKENHMALMKPMIPFQVCVLDTSQKFLTNEIFIKQHSKESGALGEEVWQEVLSECKDLAFSDKTKGLILLAYDGDMHKTFGYLEGAIYAARNYILIKGLEIEAKQP